MKKITVTFALLATTFGTAGAAEYYDGGVLADCTSKYIDVGAIESFNYEDSAWKLVMGNVKGWGGAQCALTMTTQCRNALISVMGQQNFNDNSIEGVLTQGTPCACDSDSDCVTGFKCNTSAGYKYGFCTQIANFCTNDSQCANDKGYVCSNKACTQKCDISTYPEDTDWETAARDTSDYYNFPMIEKRTSYKCSSSGSWTGTTTYRCAAHYYGTPTSASSKCTRCPDYPGPGTSDPGSTKIQDCYYPKGTQYHDTPGSYTIVNGDCHHD